MIEQRKTSNYTCSETYYMPSHTELKQYTMYMYTQNDSVSTKWECSRINIILKII